MPTNLSACRKEFSSHRTLLKLRMVIFLIFRFAGSGRESLTQLATSMAGSTLVRVNVTHNYGVKKFEEDLKPAVFGAGVHAKHVVFLLKDAQVRPQLSASKTFCRSRAIAHENGLFELHLSLTPCTFMAHARTHCLEWKIG